MRYRSIAVWSNIALGYSGGTFESEDTHPSKEAAEAVCKKLRLHGLGGQGNVFPVSTRVEPVEESDGNE